MENPRFGPSLAPLDRGSHRGCPGGHAALCERGPCGVARHPPRVAGPQGRELEALAWEAAGQQSSAGVQFLIPDMPSPARLLHTPFRAWLLFAPGDGEQNACMDGIIPGALEQDGPSLAPASAGRTPTGEARSKLAKYAGIMIRRRGGKHA